MPVWFVGSHTLAATSFGCVSKALSAAVWEHTAGVHGTCAIASQTVRVSIKPHLAICLLLPYSPIAEKVLQQIKPLPAP